MMGRNAIWAMMAVTLVLTAQATAGSADQAVSDKAMLGFNRTSGHLVRYDFSTQQLSTVGPVTLNSDTPVSGVNACGYFPGFLNIFGFWTDPQDGATKLIYVNTLTAAATIVADNVGPGTITGGTAVVLENGDRVVYAVQRVQGAGGDGGHGQDMLYVVEADDEKVKFEDAPDGLGEDGAVQTDRFVIHVSDGSNTVRVTTKAATSSATVTLNGAGSEALDSLGFRSRLLSMENGVYTLTVTSEDNSHALSHVTFNFLDDAEVESPNNSYVATRFEGDGVLQGGGEDTTTLIRVDQRTGQATPVMELAHPYEGLATQDGNTFLAIVDDKLYRVDPSAGTETLILELSTGDITTIEFVDGVLIGFDHENDQLVPLDPQTGAQLGSSADVGADDLGSMVFFPLANDPANAALSFD